MHFSRILTPVDLSGAPDQTLLYARHLAETCGTTLVYLIFDPDSDDDIRAVADFDRLPSSAREYFTNHPNPPSLEIEYHITGDDDIADNILEYSLEGDIDLIIIHSLIRKKLGWNLLDRVSQEIIQASHCAVLSLRGNYDSSPNHILAPVDFSETNKETLSFAGELAQLSHASIDLLHVVENVRVPGLFVDVANPGMEFSPELNTQIEHGLSELQHLLPADVEAEHHIEHGNAASVIVDYAADHHVDMIVIGSHGLSAIERFFLGSVADRVLQLSTCPVLLVPSIKPSLSE